MDKISLSLFFIDRCNNNKQKYKVELEEEIQIVLT